MGAQNLVLGVFARTSRGRHQLRAEMLHERTRAWLEGADPAAWWIEPRANIALLHPQAIVTEQSTGEQAVIAVQGSVQMDGRLSPPPAWSPSDSTDEHASSVLYDILERGSSALRDLRGQWALAFWNGRQNRLLLARDHLGQRVLFTRTETDLFFFCSELLPLLRMTQDGCDLDSEAAFWYLSFGMPPPGRTLARGVERLPAAHLISWMPHGAPLVARYWTPLNSEAPSTASAEAVAQIQETLDRSILACCATDAPQAIFLSGGTDSTYIAATAVSLGGKKLTAFTSAFEETLGINDDARYAASVAEWLGITHHVIPLHAERALKVLEEEVLTADEPCAAWASMTHFQLLVSAREMGVRRMLSGLGADEIFGGYEHFHQYYVRYLEYCAENPAPPSVDDFESLLLRDDLISRRILYPGIARFFDDQALGQALADPYRTWQFTPHLQAFYRECRRLKPGAHLMEMMTAHECQHRIPDLLFANFESISRRLGVAVSYPCLDPELVTRAVSLDVLSRYRTPSGTWSSRIDELQPGFKHALMLVYEKRIPELIIKRPIKTFTAPFSAWFARPDFAEPLLTRLRRSRFWQRGILQREWLDQVLQHRSRGTKDNSWSFQLWAILTLVGWYDHFVDPPG
jgi:asparagine synthase (glutamine-hydrolysing)